MRTSGTPAGIPDAPIDGTTYGRNNGAWVPVAGGGIPEAPNDGEAYARQSLGWVALELLPAPGSNGDALVVSGGAWTPVALTASFVGAVSASGGSTLSGTTTLAAGAVWDADDAGASTLVRLLAVSDDSNGAASTAWVKDYLPAPGAAGTVHRSDGTAWVVTTLAISDTTGTLAINRGGTGLTSPGASGNVLMSNGTAWTSSEVAGVKRIWICDDFLPGSVAGKLGWVYTGNGAGNFGLPNNAVISGAVGHYTINKGTSATGRAALSFETVAGQLPFVQPWLNGTIAQEWRVYLDAVAADFEAGVSLGSGAPTTGQVFDSGVGLIYDGINPTWQFQSRNATVVVATVDTGVAVPAATWVYIRTEIDAVEARVYIGATKAAATLVGQIPIASVITTAALGPLAKIRSLSAGTARNFRIDLHTTEHLLNTSR